MYQGKPVWLNLSTCYIDKDKYVDAVFATAVEMATADAVTIQIEDYVQEAMNHTSQDTDAEKQLGWKNNVLSFLDNPLVDRVIVSETTPFLFDVMRRARSRDIAIFYVTRDGYNKVINVYEYWSGEVTEIGKLKEAKQEVVNIDNLFKDDMEVN